MQSSRPARSASSVTSASESPPGVETRSGRLRSRAGSRGSDRSSRPSDFRLGPARWATPRTIIDSPGGWRSSPAGRAGSAPRSPSGCAPRAPRSRRSISSRASTEGVLALAGDVSQLAGRRRAVAARRARARSRRRARLLGRRSRAVAADRGGHRRGVAARARDQRGRRLLLQPRRCCPEWSSAATGASSTSPRSRARRATRWRPPTRRRRPR